MHLPGGQTGPQDGSQRGRVESPDHRTPEECIICEKKGVNTKIQCSTVG